MWRAALVYVNVQPLKWRMKFVIYAHIYLMKFVSVGIYVFIWAHVKRNTKESVNISRALSYYFID